MPIADRSPGADDTATPLRVAVERPGGGPAGIAAPPPEDLLPSGGSRAPVPLPVPSRALALDALRLLRRLHDPSRRPTRWGDPMFDREVDVVRMHLAPLRTRRALAASFGREAFHLMRESGPADDPGPVRLAYALRWLELGSREARSG
jgi:hypothetical protein